MHAIRSSNTSQKSVSVVQESPIELVNTVPHDYICIRSLGNGQSGSVLLGIPSKPNGTKKVALKSLGPVQQYNDNNKKAFEISEINCLNMCLGHPCIVQVKDVVIQQHESSNESRKPPTLWLVMEYIKGHPWGFSSFSKRRGPWCGTDKLQSHVLRATKQLLRDVLCGLQYLHDEVGMAHMDIKPENILVFKNEADENYHAKVIDLGSVVGCRTNTTSTAGSLYFLSPEKAFHSRSATTTIGKGYCPKAADIWALGITTIVAVFGDRDVPYPAASHFSRHDFAMGVLFPLMSSNVCFDMKLCEAPPPQEFVEFLSLMVSTDPITRPCASKLLRHLFWFSN
eukprot:PhF_6_TR14432/c0_g3_i1/m.23016/K08838/STK24_25_MST4; serine/threonine-protein kinase 24/25/MST4